MIVLVAIHLDCKMGIIVFEVWFVMKIRCQSEMLMNVVIKIIVVSFGRISAACWPPKPIDSLMKLGEVNLETG